MEKIPSRLSNTKVDLTGLLEVLGKNLYSTPSVAIRELVQNAHDACIRHNIETGSEHDHQIKIRCQNNPASLIITDNGSGLTYQEIENFLATIGSGYTRVLRNQTVNSSMIGYFGLGFLSAYVVSTKVEVRTCSFKTPDQPWLFSSNGGQRFSIEPIPAEACIDRGTEVKLILKEEFDHFSDLFFIENLLEKYCSLLPVPICLYPESKPLNIELPWHSDTSLLQARKKALAFAKVFEDQFDPLCTFPVLENDLQVDGILWIQDGGGYATSDYRNANIFIRNMFITNDLPDLLPKWAGFVGCVINTPSLTPTASREDIQRDSTFKQVQDLILKSLVTGLQQITKNEHENWRRILYRHNEGLLAAALCNDDLLQSIKDDVKVPTSLGQMSLNDVAKASNNEILIQTEEKTDYQSLLYKAQMRPVVSGYLYAASAFCQKYAEQTTGIKLFFLGLHSDDRAIFEPADIPLSEQELLQRLFEGGQQKVLCCRFSPSNIPLVIVTDMEARLKQRIESDEADKRIGSAILALARQTTENVQGDVLQRVYLNVDSPLIKHLMTIPPEKQGLLADMLKAYVLTLGQTEGSNLAEEINTFFHSLLTLIGK